MAPAIECIGCNFKAKTLTEDPNEVHMAFLFDAAAEHQREEGAKLNVLMEEEERFPMSSLNESNEFGVHLVEFRYYQTTPKQGFEEAKTPSILPKLQLVWEVDDDLGSTTECCPNLLF